MQAYLPHDASVLAILAAVAAAFVVLGYAVARSVPRALARWIAWLALAGAVLVIERACMYEPPGLRMLALMVVAMLGMKLIVLVEDRPRAGGRLRLRAWLAFALTWPGMRPHVFEQRGIAVAPPGTHRGRALPGAHALLWKGGLYFLAGLITTAFAIVWWSFVHEIWTATAIFFVGASLMVHFGLFDLIAGAWRTAGVACEELFRAPWRSQNLSEFWSRRWNLAFSEMTAIAVYRPLSGAVGRNAALIASFLVSGVLHELAISLPVRAGFGLPTAYFALHGVLVWIERDSARRGKPVRGPFGRVWTFIWLVVPLPILFHRAFLEGIVWPLIGIG